VRTPRVAGRSDKSCNERVSTSRGGKSGDGGGAGGLRELFVRRKKRSVSLREELFSLKKLSVSLGKVFFCHGKFP
jgi:hypothetical protein